MSNLPARMLSDDERDRAIATLERHYAAGHLDVTEFEQRVEASLHASSAASLEMLLADLPALPTAALAAPRPAPWVVSSTLSSIERTGDFAVAGPVLARARFGSVELDLRDANLQSGFIDIDVRVMCGSVRIVLPEGARAIVDCQAVLGSVEVLGEPSLTPGGSVIHIGGRVVLGALEVVQRPTVQVDAPKALPDANRRLLPR